MYFKSWPFRVVPERSSDLWADRKKLLRYLNFLLSDSIEKKRSTLYCIWGYVGAGKSHSLLHFKWLFEKKGRAATIYSPLPKQMRRYADLYQQGFFNSINFLSFSRISAEIWAKLNPKGVDVGGEMKALEKVNNEITDGWLDMAQVIMTLGKTVALTGSPRDPLCLLSQTWLSGKRLSKRELRELGISANIMDDSDFVRATSSVIRTLTYKGEGCDGYDSLFWMLDDCHFFASIRRQSQRDFTLIQQGLRDVFDACPNNLCLLLSFASRDASKIQELLIEDVLSRICFRIEISPLSEKDSLDFIVDLINNERFRKEEVRSSDAYYPYTKDVIKQIIQYISQVTDLTPRNMMKYLDEITTKAERKLYPKKIGADFIKSFFEGASSYGC